MRARLQIPSNQEGALWRYAHAASANRRHTHAELELNLVTHGYGTYFVGARRYRIRRGDLIWLFPAQEHVLFEQSADFSMWVAVFRRKSIRAAATTEASRALLQKDLETGASRRLLGDDMQRLEVLLRELSADGTGPDVLNAGLRYAMLLAWQSFERATGMGTHDLHPAVERAAKLLREDPETASLPRIARRSGLSAARLSRLFKAQTGYALTDFRSRVRLDRFLELYGAGHRLSMLDAALSAGFGSYPQFHRVFTRIMGRSPRDYRRDLE
ncbi:helix-turn-helix domain-containing protein [Bryocella elongata]|uniref:helix-turn-helix domain-containing protein n=1 Tax=Bryocella elongata TaxID=863522 RepID=UPI00135A8786|nr:helix-turn-helix domain-containing protein [Bryocella elongata]